VEVLCVDIAALRSLVMRTVPFREERNLPKCISNIRNALNEYAELKGAYGRQMSSKLRRKTLNEGRDILKKLESWIARSESTITRNYVLSAMRSEQDQRRRADSLMHVWREQLANVRQWQTRLDQALLFVQSDRGQPEDFPLKQLVRDLAKIWDRYAVTPFSTSRKGSMPPADFVAEICRSIEPDLTGARIQTAIRHAVKMTPGKRRGRKSHQSKRD
jgi:hypothetical protein